MHRIAIGDAQGVCHQLLALLRIRMVDGESVRREFYPRGFGGPGLTICGHCRCLVELRRCVHVDISSGARITMRGRFCDAQAIIRRARAGATSIVGKDFCLQSRRTARRWTGSGTFYRLRDDVVVPLICPTCQNVFLRALKASVPEAACYFAWGCFRYFSRERGRRAFWVVSSPSSLSRCSSYAGHHASPLRLRLAAPRVARKGEAWWACLDSNQEPDRYERPALTIELQAPPRTAASSGRQRCGHRLQPSARSGNAGLNPPKRRRIPRLCATSRSRQ